MFLPGFLAPELVEQLAAGVERDLAEPGPLAITMAPADGSGQFVEDFCRWSDIPEYRAVVEASGMGRAAAELMGTGEVRLFHDHMLVKEAGSSIRTPWHQDQPYYCIDGSQTISFWIPLDPVRAPRRPSSWPARTVGNWFMPRSFLAGSALVFDEGTLEEVPDVEADRDAFPILGWEMQPGDAVAFNMLTLHAAGPADSRRRAVSFRPIGEDVRYGPRPHRTSPPFPGLDEELAAGEPMGVDRLFPVLYPVGRYRSAAGSRSSGDRRYREGATPWQPGPPAPEALRLRPAAGAAAHCSCRDAGGRRDARLRRRRQGRAGRRLQHRGRGAGPASPRRLGLRGSGPRLRAGRAALQPGLRARLLARSAPRAAYGRRIPELVARVPGRELAG